MNKLPESVTINSLYSKVLDGEANQELNNYITMLEADTVKRFTVSSKSKFYVNGNKVYRCRGRNLETDPIIVAVDEGHARQRGATLGVMKGILEQNKWHNYLNANK